MRPAVTVIASSPCRAGGMRPGKELPICHSFAVKGSTTQRPLRRAISEASRIRMLRRLQNYIALLCVVAWRLHWLRYINCTAPDLPCTHILTTVEWQALYLPHAQNQRVPYTLADRAPGGPLDCQTWRFLGPQVRRRTWHYRHLAWLAAPSGLSCYQACRSHRGPPTCG